MVAGPNEVFAGMVDYDDLIRIFLIGAVFSPLDLFKDVLYLFFGYGHLTRIQRFKIHFLMGDFSLNDLAGVWPVIKVGERAGAGVRVHVLYVL